MSLLDVTNAEAAHIHDNSEKILNHKEKQYDLTLRMAADLKKEIKAKYRDRLQLLTSRMQSRYFHKCQRPTRPTPRTRPRHQQAQRSGGPSRK
jgi:hypothetical protein